MGLHRVEPGIPSLRRVIAGRLDAAATGPAPLRRRARVRHGGGRGRARGGTGRRLLIPLVALALLAGPLGCGRHEPVSPLSPDWRPVALPAPDARIADLAGCADRWYAVGTSGGRPAAWTSADGVAWRPVALRPATYYGQQGSFTSVACRGSDVVALSSASGGVHGNPRVSVWCGASGTAVPAAGGVPAADDPPGDGWREVPVPFELFGGPLAGSVGRVVAGSAAWLIVGSRVSPTTGRHGAAVWVSADGEVFHLVDDAPALRSTDDALAAVHDAAPRPDGGWLLVGSIGRPTAPRPAAWTSPDGLHWTRAHVERSEAGAVQRAVPLHDRLLAVGDDGGAVHLWRTDPTGTRLDTSAVMGGAGGGTEVTALATVPTAAGSLAVAAVGGGLFGVTDGTGAAWRPIRPPAGTGDGDRLLLAGKGSTLLVAVTTTPGAVGGPSGATALWSGDLASV